MATLVIIGSFYRVFFLSLTSLQRPILFLWFPVCHKVTLNKLQCSVLYLAMSKHPSHESLPQWNIWQASVPFLHTVVIMQCNRTTNNPFKRRNSLWSEQSLKVAHHKLRGVLLTCCAIEPKHVDIYVRQHLMPISITYTHKQRTYASCCGTF